MRCDAQNAESAQRTPTQDNKTIACQTNRINKFKECLQCRDDYDEDNNRRNKANEQKYENALNKLHTTAQKKSCGRKKRCQTIHRRAHSLSKKEFSVFMVKVKEIRETMVVFTWIVEKKNERRIRNINIVWFSECLLYFTFQGIKLRIGSVLLLRLFYI